MSRRQAIWQDGDIGPQIGEFIGAQSNMLNYQRQRDMAASKVPPKIDFSFIDKAKVEDSGLSAVDHIKNQALPEVKTWAFNELQSGKNPMEVQMGLMQKVSQLDSSYTLAKNQKAIIDANLVKIATQYPQGDIGKLKAMLYKDAANDIVNVDESGRPIGLKDASIVPVDKDYTTQYLEPGKMGSWMNPHGSLQKYAEDIKLNDISDNDKFDDKGRMVRHGYKGKSNALSRPILDDKGNTIGQETAFDEIEIGDKGEKVKVLPAHIEQEILADPVRATELNQMAAQDLAAYELKTGKDLSNKEAEAFMRHRLYSFMDEHKTHTFNQNDEIKIPKPPVTNISINNGNKDVPVRQMYKPIYEKVTNPNTPSIKVEGKYLGTPMTSLESDESESMLAEYKKATGDNDVKSSELFMRAENNQLKLYKMDDEHPIPRTAGELKNYQLPASFVVISAEGTDFKAQTGVKTKDKVVSNYSNGGNNPAPAKPKAATTPLLKGTVR